MNVREPVPTAYLPFDLPADIVVFLVFFFLLQRKFNEDNLSSETTRLAANMGGKAGEWRPSHQERYQQPFMTGNNRQWKEADIAFFVPHDRFSDEEEKELLAPKQGKRHGEIPRKATGHPAIILKRISEKSTHVLIVAISSHSATEQNNYQPPWEQPGHAWKKPNDFRALVGSQRPNHRPPIYLEDGKPMPKDRGWIRYVPIASHSFIELTELTRFQS